MASLMLVNPKKRRKKRKGKRRSVAKASPRRRRRKAVKRYSRRRRNPAKRGMQGIIQNTVMPAATAAAGAIGLDLIMGYLPLPTAMKTGPMRHVIKGAAAIGMGMLAANFVKRSTAEAFTTGAMTVVMYNAGREAATRFMPNLPLSAYDEYGDNDMEGLGYYSAGYDPDSEMMGLDLEGDESLMAYPNAMDDFDDDDDMGGMGYVEDELDY